MLHPVYSKRITRALDDNGCYCCILEINIPSGTPILLIQCVLEYLNERGSFDSGPKGAYDFFVGEKEVLLMHGLCYKVKSIRYDEVVLGDETAPLDYDEGDDDEEEEEADSVEDEGEDNKDRAQDKPKQLKQLSEKCKNVRGVTVYTLDLLPNQKS